MTELFEPPTSTTRGWCAARRACWATFNRAGVLDGGRRARRPAARRARRRDRRARCCSPPRWRCAPSGTARCASTSTQRVRRDVGTGPARWPDGRRDWADARSRRSPLLADAGAAAPGELGLLYLDRYWRQEAAGLRRPAGRRRPRGPAGSTEPRAATRAWRGCSRRRVRRAADGRRARGRTPWTTVLDRRPGHRQDHHRRPAARAARRAGEPAGRPLRVALAAPTGKAAARLQEAVADSRRRRCPPRTGERLGALQATTLHRLLGWRPRHGTRFRHDRGNRLPLRRGRGRRDVDGVADDDGPAARGAARRRPAGAGRRPRPARIGRGRRGARRPGRRPAPAAPDDAGRPAAPARTGFGAGIGALGRRRCGRARPTRCSRCCRAGGDVELLEPDDPAPRAARAACSRPRADGAHGARRARATPRVRSPRWSGTGCCARTGRARSACTHWNRQVEHWLGEATGDPLYDAAYAGRPLLVTANDYGLGVYNGDTGVVVRDGDGPCAPCSATADGLRQLGPGRLGAVRDDARDDHPQEPGRPGRRGDGGAAARGSRLLTRELLYTAVTRARHRVRVVGTEESLRAAVSRRVQRASGLRQRLAALTPGAPGG